MKSRYAGILACLVSGVLCGCSRGPVEIHDIRSPNGKVILRIEINEAGGAAVPDVTSAYLFFADTGPTNKQLIFKGSAMSNFSATWRGQKLIVLSYSAGYVSTCNARPVLPAEVKINVIGCRAGHFPAGGD